MIIIQTDGIDLGDQVYLKTDEDQAARMVIAVGQYLGGSVRLLLARGTDYTWHHIQEVSKERNVVLASTG